MYCKWCGMDSKDNSRCEWCGRPFVGTPGSDATTAVPQATTAVPPATTSVPQATTAIPVGMTAAQAAAQAQFRVYVPELPPFWERFEKYLSIMLLLLPAGVLYAHYNPTGWLWYVPILVLSLISGILLGAFRVIGYYDDEVSDVMIVLVVTAFVGPVYSMGIYLVLALIKQDINMSMFGLMLSFFAIRLAVGSAAHGFMDTIYFLGRFTLTLDLMGWIVQLFPMCVLFGGWMAASFTRPLNE